MRLLTESTSNVSVSTRRFPLIVKLDKVPTEVRLLFTILEPKVVLDNTSVPPILYIVVVLISPVTSSG